jgi:uncharacterized protein YbaA (DUF1428 family)
MYDMAYIDGFLIPVPIADKDSYLETERTFGAIFKEYGALQVVTAWQDDVPEGVHTSFPMAVKREEGEAVGFSWIYWPDKATRDEGNAKFMADPRVVNWDPASMVFDGKRMVFGGFEVLVEL